MSTAVPNNGSSQVATQNPAPARSSRGNGESPFTDIASSRKTTNSIMGGLMWLCMILALIPLLWLLITVVSRGLGAVIDPAWWTQDMVGVRSSKPRVHRSRPGAVPADLHRQLDRACDR